MDEMKILMCLNRTELEKISNRDRPEWKCFSPLVSAVRAKPKDLIKLMIEDLGFDIDSICTENVLELFTFQE
jgi:hypothetical protein